MAAAQLVCFTLETRPDASRAVCLLHSSNRIGSIRDSRTPMLRVGPPLPERNHRRIIAFTTAPGLHSAAAREGGERDPCE